MLTHRKSNTNKSKVTIRSRGKVQGGTPCGPCVENKYVECSITECLCAKNNHVVSLYTAHLVRTIEDVNYALS